MREDSLSMNQPAPPESERTSCVEETMQDVFNRLREVFRSTMSLENSLCLLFPRMCWASSATGTGTG